jgi:hypothetical protein
LPALILLTSPDSVNNRPLISLLSIHHVISNAKEHRGSKKEATPVHGNRSDGRGRWKEAKEKCNYDVPQTDRVCDWSENWPHMPRSPAELVLDWIISKSFVEDEGNGYTVGGHETCYDDADDCVESGGASNIDESEEKGYGCCDENRVQRETRAWMDLYSERISVFNVLRTRRE